MSKYRDQLKGSQCRKTADERPFLKIKPSGGISSTVYKIPVVRIVSSELRIIQI